MRLRTAALAASVPVLIAGTAGATTFASTTASGADSALCDTVPVNVDVNTVRATASPENIGLSLSMFGVPLPYSPTRQQLINRLGVGLVQVPVYWDAEKQTTFAGVPRSGDNERGQAQDIIRAVEATGAEPLVIILGKTSDVDFTPDDAAQIVRELAPAGVRLFGISNEPGNRPTHFTSQRTIEFFNARAAAMRAVDPTILIGGPNWAWYEESVLHEFALHADYDFISWHQYATGADDTAAAATLEHTTAWRDNAASIQSWMSEAGKTDPERNFVLVGELNWSWRYNPDSANSRTAFRSPDIVVWSASVLGHLLESGYRANFYADQAGPIGVITQPVVETWQQTKYRTAPIYHGIGAWTGEGDFPGLGERSAFYSVTGAPAGVDVFAMENSNGTMRIVLINRTPAPVPVALPAGVATDWQSYATNPDRPADGYVQGPEPIRCESTTALAIEGKTVTVLVAQR